MVAALEVIAELLERQAIRRVAAGSLTDDDIERPGQALMAVREQLAELRSVLGVCEYVLASVADLAREPVSLPGTARRTFLIPLADVEKARALVAGLSAEFVAPLPAYSFLTPVAASRWGW
ncbi:gas vesicle protein K [Kibdelosporangium philippinense]|uniref:Gas vesicle protein K n=1 Tax=Kibdelosporangium philippinense TaxID=211113 RepID=A0ABS8Z4S2_9PSEU|nr:gas vesicle protein K [Kibdelosporangium philippinense]